MMANLFRQLSFVPLSELISMQKWGPSHRRRPDGDPKGGILQSAVGACLPKGGPAEFDFLSDLSMA